MRDIDSYLWKCSLEAMAKGVKKEKIQELCKCQMGFTQKVKLKNKTGDK